MAKACAYLCRHCRFIDGFCEFGEKMSHISLETEKSQLMVAESALETKPSRSLSLEVSVQ